MQDEDAATPAASATPTPTTVALARPASFLLLAAVSFAAFGGGGAWLPYLGLYLERTGYSGAAIGAFLAVLPVARIASAPLWALVADRYRLGTRLLQLLSVVSMLVAVGILFLPAGAVLLGVMLVIFSALRSPIGPLMDSTLVKTLEDGGGDARDYGRIRLWGSVGFLVAALGGALLSDGVAWAGAPLGLAVLIWVVGAGLAFRLPSTDASGPARIGPALKALYGQAFFQPFLLALVLHGAAMATYDALMAVHIDRLGLHSAWTGACIVTGILVEVGVMYRGRAILGRFSPIGLVAFAMLASALRWVLTAVVREPVLLVLIQALHGISFGVFWIGGVEVMRTRAAAEVRASAQAVLSTSAYGVGPLVSATVAAGVLAGRPGADGTSTLFWMGAVASALAGGLVLLSRARERRGVVAA